MDLSDDYDCDKESDEGCGGVKGDGGVEGVANTVESREGTGLRCAATAFHAGENVGDLLVTRKAARADIPVGANCAAGWAIECDVVALIYGVWNGLKVVGDRLEAMEVAGGVHAASETAQRAKMACRRCLAPEVSVHARETTWRIQPSDETIL